MENLKSVLKTLKIDLTKAVIIHEGGHEYQPASFDIKPKDYLRFAKEDFEVSTLKRNRINALSNAKRAIDCQIDEIIQVFDLNVKDTSSRDIFLKEFELEPDLTINLQLVQALNFSPSYLISKVRNIRNQVEHEYKNPSHKDVKEAVEIADLFIRSVQGKIRVFECDFLITDKNKITQAERPTAKEGINSTFNQDTRSFNLKLKSEKTLNITSELVIRPDQKEFYPLLRISNSTDDEFELLKSFKLLIKSIQHKIPEGEITCKLY